MITYNAGISACERGHRPTGPHKLQQLRPRGFMPNVITCNAGFSACEKGHRPTGPHKLQQLQPRGFMPNVITYNAAISTCDKGKTPHQARIYSRSYGPEASCPK